jgi:hypothetical protein
MEAYGQMTNTSWGWWAADKLLSWGTGKVKYLSNASENMVSKSLISYGFSKMGADFLAGKIVGKGFKVVEDMARALMDFDADVMHDKDLKEMVKKYKTSIRSGHGVIMVTHSQGNLFAVEAADKIVGVTELGDDAWMKKFLYHVSIASPATKFARSNYYWLTSLDNDPVANNPGSVGPNYTNYARYYTYKATISPATNTPTQEGWAYQPPANLDSPAGYWVRGSKPSNYTAIQSYYDPTLQISQEYRFEVEADEWQYAQVNFHAFDFYMGRTVYPLYKTSYNVWTPPKDLKIGEYKSKTHKHIIAVIKDAIEMHKKMESQWETNQEYEKNTCDYRITVKHRFDPSIEMGETVYPFNGSKKLYQVKGEYVKASSGGKNILSAWEGKKENECYKIDNPQEEKIVDKRVVYKEHINYSILAAIHWDGTLREVIDLYAYNKSIFVYHYAHSSIGVQADLNENGTTPTREEYASWIEKGYSAMMQKIPLLETKINTFMLKKQTDLVKKYGRDNVRFSAAENTYENCKQHSNYPSEQTCRKSFNVAVSVKAVEDPFRKK